MQLKQNFFKTGPYVRLHLFQIDRNVTNPFKNWATSDSFQTNHDEAF